MTQSRNGNTNSQPVLSLNPNAIQTEETHQESNFVAEPFDQPVILQQTSIWSRAIVWGIVGVTTFAVGWAAIAKVEEAVPARGKLEPVGRVQEVQAPATGVVQDITVEDGERVEAGEVLVRLNPTAAQAQFVSLQSIREKLLQENQVYRTLLSGQGTLSPEQAVELELPAEMLALASSRNALFAENQLYRAQLAGVGSAPGLDLEDQFRLQELQRETASRFAAAELEVSQLERQYAQNQIESLAAQENLAINQDILSNLTPLFEEGGIARLQYVRQEQEVLNSEAEVARLIQEEQRLQFAIAQAQQRLQNTASQSSTEVLGRMSDNEKRIAEIDSQFNRAIVDNERRIAEVEGQLAQAQLNVQYQEIRSPIDGIVFDIQTQVQGVLANSNEPILKIVPGDELTARVYVTNRDIGFIEEGMRADVRIDSFPFSEYGDIEGELIRIGSDALPPDQLRNAFPNEFVFPVDIKLDAQYLVIRDREINLQSGMSVSVNIKTRKRTVLSIFTDLFVRKVESVTTSR